MNRLLKNMKSTLQKFERELFSNRRSFREKEVYYEEESGRNRFSI